MGQISTTFYTKLISTVQNMYIISSTDVSQKADFKVEITRFFLPKKKQEWRRDVNVDGLKWTNRWQKKNNSCFPLDC